MRYSEQLQNYKTQKLKDLINKFANGKQVELANRIGVSGSVIHQWLKFNTFDAEKLLFAFPDLSAEWLMRGSGPMMLSEAPARNTITQGDNSAASINGSAHTATLPADRPQPPLSTADHIIASLLSSQTALLEQNRTLTNTLAPRLEYLEEVVRKLTKKT